MTAQHDLAAAFFAALVPVERPTKPKYACYYCNDTGATSSGRVCNRCPDDDLPEWLEDDAAEAQVGR